MNLKTLLFCLGIIFGVIGAILIIGYTPIELIILKGLLGMWCYIDECISYDVHVELHDKPTLLIPYTSGQVGFVFMLFSAFAIGLRMILG